MKRLQHALITALAAFICIIFHTQAFAQAGSALKNDSLRASPFADAKVTGQLVRAENVTILQKQGAWLQVKTAKASGWVRLLSIRRGNASPSNQLKGATAVASGRAGTGQVVSTTGVRGLSEETLKAASFNETEVQLLESYTASEAQAKQFASTGDLKVVPFSNLTAPNTSAGANK